jgi:hypothetical protein
MGQSDQPLGLALQRGVRRLSPLNLQGLLRREVFDYSPSQEEAKKKERKSARYTHAYACPECDGLHRWEDDAEACCQGAKSVKPAKGDDYANLCPVCGSENDSAQDASDCCLWKDIDQPTRHAMADRVAQGSAWARELGVWPPETPNGQWSR